MRMSGLLWREGEPSLPKNYEMAKKRLQSLEKKFESCPEVREREMQSQSRITLRKAMWRNWVKRKYSAIVKWLGTYHTDLSLTSRNLIVSEEHGQNSDSQRFETGARVSKKNSYYARVLASDYIQQIMASCVRYSSKNSRGIFLQMHNISSAGPLWDKKKCRKRKAYVSSDYSAVERLISRRTSHGTVSSQFALVIYFINFLTY